MLQAANRLAAWSASVRVAAVSGLAARREQSGRESGDWRPFDHVDDEVALALTLTRRGAARLLDLALALDRLPLTRAALAAGLIDERRAEVIAEEVAELDDEHAAAVEKLIIGRAPKLTSGQLRALVRRAVLSADPKAAQRRKEKALQDARVEMFPETSGTAALTFATLETSDCTHPRQSRGYQPSPSLRHLIQVRNPTCTGPSCRRPATRCDLDHVTPYDQGGKTCECNLHPASKS